jgi:hypothetical protein
MPLDKCLPGDRKCVGDNISKLISEGYPQDQAVAIALSDASINMKNKNAKPKTKDKK